MKLNSTVRIRDLYKQGVTALDQKHKEEAKAKLGTLRAGNSGCLLPDGNVVGACHRLAFLRMKGIETDAPFHTKLMWQGGIANEEAWIETLKAAGSFKTILREEEAPVSWKTDAGVVVSGRPDIVCKDDSDTPLLGVELKEISSIWTFRDCIINGHPKAANLAQAMHYMWQLKCPYKLVYTSRCNFPVDSTGWMGKQFPKIGQPGSDLCEYNTKDNIKSVIPGMKAYDLFLDDDGNLSFRDECSTAKPTATNLSITALKEFYEAISTMEKDNALGPKPCAIDWDGNKMGFDVCGYCDFCPACSTYAAEGKTCDVGAWEAACRKIAEEGLGKKR